MQKVQPIKNICDIEKIKLYLKESNRRNYLLFVIGINTGIKSNQILNLKVKDVVDDKYNVKKYINIECKEYFINEPISQAIREFLKENELELNSYLFESQKSDLPINRSHLYRILNKAVNECNIDIHIGNETLRKTFGYHYYYKTRDVKYLKEIFNQASQKTLFEYLDIANELVECKEFFL
ncbi:MAG: tyrosine-type recombinase/integrase [Paraclostridium sp.]